MKMKENQALEVMKQVMDIAIQRGNFQNAETVAVALEAYRIIAEALEAGKKQSEEPVVKKIGK